MVSFSKSSQEGSSRNAVEEPTGRDDNVMFSFQEGSSRNAVEEPTGRDDNVPSYQKGSSRSAVEEPTGRDDNVPSFQKGSSRNTVEEPTGRGDTQNNPRYSSSKSEAPMLLMRFMKMESSCTFLLILFTLLHNVQASGRPLVHLGQYCFTKSDDDVKSEMHEKLKHCTDLEDALDKDLKEFSEFRALRELTESVSQFWDCEGNTVLIEIDPIKYELIFCWSVNTGKPKEIKLKPIYARALMYKEKLVLLVKEKGRKYYWRVTPELNDGVVSLEFRCETYLKFTYSQIEYDADNDGHKEVVGMMGRAGVNLDLEHYAHYDSSYGIKEREPGPWEAVTGEAVMTPIDELRHEARQARCHRTRRGEIREYKPANDSDKHWVCENCPNGKYDLKKYGLKKKDAKLFPHKRDHDLGLPKASLIENKYLKCDCGKKISEEFYITSQVVSRIGDAETHVLEKVWQIRDD